MRERGVRARFLLPFAAGDENSGGGRAVVVGGVVGGTSELRSTAVGPVLVLVLGLERAELEEELELLLDFDLRRVERFRATE